MKVYCTERFKSEFHKLAKSNSYRSLESEIIKCFFSGTDDEIRHGIIIAQHVNGRIVKKRLGGRSGFRAYFYAYLTETTIYLAYIYPKTGTEGKKSLNRTFQALLFEETADSIRYGTAYAVSVHQDKLHFAAQ